MGHEIFSEDERNAWQDLFRRHLGPGKGCRALDLASGTGVISHLLHGLGFDVTGLDWSEPMLSRARAKAARRVADIRFVMGTLKQPESYDVLVTRHLVWTLVDPKAVFRAWHSLLKPGGRLLVVDGDFVSDTFVKRMIRVMEKLVPGLSGAPHAPNAMRETHQRILERVYFSNGARAEAMAALLREAGFAEVTIDRDLKALHSQQAKNLPLLKGSNVRRSIVTLSSPSRPQPEKSWLDASNRVLLTGMKIGRNGEGRWNGVGSVNSSSVFC